MNVPTYTLEYSTDMVCKECGSTEWHVNVFFNNRNGKWFEGEDEYGTNAVWCHKCEGECRLIDPEENDVRPSSNA